MIWDVLIRGGRIVDGTGAPWYRGDVAIRHGQIVAIGRLKHTAARETIDAGGLFVAPGFIDAHSHSEDSVLVNPRGESKIRQGVTTEVIGNCGYSMAPLSGEATEKIGHDLRDLGVPVTWRTFGQYLKLIRRQGTAVNLVPLVGHGTVRQSVLGYANRPASPAELERMCRLVATAIRQGARGFSTGLIYPPSSYAETPELIALARVVAGSGGIYTSHIRGESETLLEAVCEAIAIGEAAGLPVQLSHHKAAGPGNWGRVRESLALVEAARERGVDVTLDVYPYTAASTGLAVILPGWAQEGGRGRLLSRLVDHDVRPALARAAEADVALHGGWGAILICSVRTGANRALLGLNMLEVAARRGQAPVEAALDLLVEEEGAVDMARFVMCEEDVIEVLKHPLAMIGSDASSRAPHGPLAKGKPHPRAYGTFPRVLGRYVRELGVLRLEAAVAKMTGLPAARFHLFNRGLIRPGFAADVTLFDPESVTDLATYAEPHQFPTGIPWVLVNGQVVVRDSLQTESLPGRVL